MPTTGMPTAADTDRSRGDRPAAEVDLASLVAVFEAAGYNVQHGRYWRAAIAFYHRHRHLRVPVGRKEDGINLYAAVDRVRARYHAEQLTQAQVAAWESIGMTWKAIRRHLTDSERAAIVRRHNEDMPPPSIRELAREFDSSYGAVHRVLENAGVTFRPRGGAKTPPAAMCAGGRS